MSSGYMSEKFPGFFTAIFGSKKKDEPKEKTVERRVQKERMFPDSDKRIYYPVKSKEEAEPVEDVEDAE